MIGAAPWDEIDFTPEWRRTVVGCGHWSVYDSDEPERVICSTWDRQMAEDCADWERRRREREARAL